MESTNTQELTSYLAKCHCGAVSFTVKIPSLTDHEVASCNCSICMRNGYLLIYPDVNNVEFHSGRDHLTSYFFGAKRIAHKFCPTCGCSVHAEANFNGKQFMPVNVRLFQDIDIKALKLKYGDWKSVGMQYVVPESPDTSTLSQSDSESELTRYYGNCHCGAVTFTFHIPSLEEHDVVECNCSICTCNGYLVVYPERKQVAFHTGYDDLQQYQFGAKRNTHKFCRVCGSSVLIDFNGRTVRGADRLGINVRMVQDIDPKKLKLHHFDGKSFMPESKVEK